MDERRFNQLGAIASIFFALAGFGFILISWQKLPPLVPLYYSLVWGESQLASVSTIFILPIFPSLILLLNFILNRLFKTKGLLLSFCLWTSAIVSFLSFFTLVRIILLII